MFRTLLWSYMNVFMLPVTWLQLSQTNFLCAIIILGILSCILTFHMQLQWFCKTFLPVQTDRTPHPHRSDSLRNSNRWLQREAGICTPGWFHRPPNKHHPKNKFLTCLAPTSLSAPRTLLPSSLAFLPLFCHAIILLLVLWWQRGWVKAQSLQITRLQVLSVVLLQWSTESYLEQECLPLLWWHVCLWR